MVVLEGKLESACHADWVKYFLKINNTQNQNLTEFQSMGLVLPASEIKWEKLKHTCILRITGEDLIVYEYAIDSRDKLLPRVT